MSVAHDQLLARLALFYTKAASVSSTAALRDLTEDIADWLGFRWIILMRRVSLRVSRDDAIFFDNYPAEWLQQIMDEGLYLDSAPVIASMGSVLGVCWNKIGALSRRQATIRRRSRSFGLRGGFTVSVPRDFGEGGVFGVARQSTRDTSEVEKVALHTIAMSALANAHRLSPPRGTTQQPMLAPRQLECTTLVARGKTDWEISQILGVSPDTVHEYIETARKRFGVRTRTQLVLEAIRAGQLSIDEIPR